MVTTNGKTSKENQMTEAEIERAEQIANAEAAYKRGEITAEELLWFRIITAKYILDAATPQKAG
jgi:uncharacterized membrane protein